MTVLMMVIILSHILAAKRPERWNGMRWLWTWWLITINLVNQVLHIPYLYPYYPYWWTWLITKDKDPLIFIQLCQVHPYNSIDISPLSIYNLKQWSLIKGLMKKVFWEWEFTLRSYPWAGLRASWGSLFPISLSNKMNIGILIHSEPIMILVNDQMNMDQ